jgi:hypothetical protein
MFEVLGMARKNTLLLKPIVFNLAISVPVSLALAVGYGSVQSPALAYVVMAVGVSLLYFIDYFCNALTVTLIYDQVTGKTPTMANAMSNAKRSAVGIAMFAAVSGLFDLLASYASERDDVLGKILSQIIYMVWTTAVYFIMPSMVIEGIGFGEAFSRSKKLMKEDPTQVGSGVVGISLANWVLGGICATVAYAGLNALSHIHPILGAAFFFIFFNLYWSLAGYLKITYFTCFYVWANECATKKASDPAFAPEPLARALA